MTRPLGEDQKNKGNESCGTILRRELGSRDDSEGLVSASDLPLEFLENTHV